MRHVDCHSEEARLVKGLILQELSDAGVQTSLEDHFSLRSISWEDVCLRNLNTEEDPTLTQEGLVLESFGFGSERRGRIGRRRQPPDGSGKLVKPILDLAKERRRGVYTR